MQKSSAKYWNTKSNQPLIKIIIYHDNVCRTPGIQGCKGIYLDINRWIDITVREKPVIEGFLAKHNKQRNGCCAD